MINVKMQQPSTIQKLSPRIAVIGVGGAGGNAVNNMISSNLEGCEFLVCNTDAQALSGSLSENRIQLGVNITGGLGAGSKPEIGQAAAEETLEDVMRYLDGANMAFVTAGMGGGTGTGAAPIIAKACREQGILTVGVVTKPFHFEGAHRMEQAERGIKEMQQYVDTLIVIPNQNLFRIANEKTTFAEAFKMADTVLQSGVRGVTDLMVRPGLVNLDFADIKTAMQQMGKAMMGTGEATGDKRAIEAAEAAIKNPLLDDVSMKGAQGVIINVTGGYDMTLFEADEACNRIRDEVDPNANIIFGATFDENMDGYMRVSIVATGIDTEASKGRIFTGGGGNGGGLSASNVNKQMPTAPIFEREKQTASASDSMRHNAVNAISGREAIRGLRAPTTPVTASAQAAAAPQVFQKQQTEAYRPTTAAAVVNAESFDMFDDSSYIEPPKTKAEEPKEQAALRGSTYGNAFIPPKPMEADMRIPENGVGKHISNFHAQHVPEKPVVERSTYQERAAMAQEQVPQPQKRSPSLLERITGSVQQTIDSFRDDSDMIQHKPQQAERAIESKPAAPDRPYQPMLNISEPAKPAQGGQSDLDIPAFLRRQAN